MKKVIYLFTVLPIIGSAQTPEEVKAFALEIAQKCCSNAYEIIEQEDAENVATWMENDADRVHAMDFSTTVHECLHGYDTEIGWRSEVDEEYYGSFPEGYFIDNGIKIIVPERDVFKTATLHPNYYPKEVQELFRYGTYIHEAEGETNWVNATVSEEEREYYQVFNKSESVASSNVSGIFGLLEEFNAYYHGALADYELMHSGVQADRFSTSSYITAAYYEFNIFMAYYLKYAKENEHKTYDMLMKLRELRVAYTLCEKNWRTFLTNIYSDPEDAVRYPSYEGEEELYTPELRAIMESFMLQDAELSSYSHFLVKQRYNPKAIAQNRPSKNEHNNVDFAELMDDMGELEDFPEFPSGGARITINGQEAELKEEGQYYIVLFESSDMMTFMNEYVDVMMRARMEPGIYQEGSNLFLYLKKYPTNSEAQDYLNSIRSDFPNAVIK